jgi:hypothetical protein
MRLFVAIIETDNGDGIWILETKNSLKMGAYLVGGGREIKDGLSFSGKCGSRWMKKGD